MEAPLRSRPARSSLPPADDRPTMLSARGVTKSFPLATARPRLARRVLRSLFELPVTVQLALIALEVERKPRLRGQMLEVLHGVDFDLCEGELLALVGSSGAGKSTLLHCLGLLDRPTEGSVLIRGRDAWSLPLDERARVRNRQIGFVFQFYHLLPELTALENVMLPGMIGASRLDFRRNGYRARALELLERFGLADRIAHRPEELSGGERQRVAMARALLLEPAILLADEPTGNLDSATAAVVLDLLLEEQRRRKLSMILVTHDEKIARRCERVITMKDGRIVG
jgi:lipoprotein-releasing system ATP-binding protein